MIQDALRIELELLASDFIRKYDELGMRASGEWAESLEVRMFNSKGEIWGNDYTQYLTNGRKGGTLPPINAIEDWVRNKFGLSDQKQITSTAWAVAKGIEKKGTTWYQQGGSDLIDAILNEEREQEIINNVGAFVLAEITEEIKRAIA